MLKAFQKGKGSDTFLGSLPSKPQERIHNQLEKYPFRMLEPQLEFRPLTAQFDLFTGWEIPGINSTISDSEMSMMVFTPDFLGVWDDHDIQRIVISRQEKVTTNLLEAITSFSEELLRMVKEK